MTETVHQKIDRLRLASERPVNRVEVFREYARGDQPSTLSVDMRRSVHGLDISKFCDNICDKIVATVAARAELTGWSVDDSEVEKFLDELWTKNRMPRKQYDVHYADVRDGNVAVLLGWQVTDRSEDGTPSKGRVTITIEPWWNGTVGSWVCYEEDDEEPSFAVKDWEILDPANGPRSKRTVMRRNIYWPDRIERFVLRGKTWSQWDGSGTDEYGTILAVEPWVKDDGSPLGIPMIHFANQKASNIPAYGMSDLDGGILGIQDQINDIHHDITAAARLSGFQVYYITGYTADTDSSGKPLPMYIGPGYVIRAKNTDTKVGALQAGDMSQLIETLSAKKQAAASSTRTPEHVIAGGQWPSGLALMRAEQPLVDKTQQLTRTVSPSWTTLAHRATEIANTYGGLNLNEDALISAVFTDPQRLDPTAQAEADKAKVEALTALQGLTDEVLLKKSGLLTEKEIKALMKERDARAEKELAALVSAPFDGQNGGFGRTGGSEEDDAE